MGGIFYFPQSPNLPFRLFLKRLSLKTYFSKQSILFKKDLLSLQYPSKSGFNFKLKRSPFLAVCSLKGRTLVFNVASLEAHDASGGSQEGWLGYSVTAVPRKHNSCRGYSYLQPLYKRPPCSASHQIAHKILLQWITSGNVFQRVHLLQKDQR